jgi:AraC family transcriptional regulator of adaptative response/methylated-DNA-[protein]-cysteine methyltransferase
MEHLLELTPQEHDESRWQAVLTRDASRDADFVYGVLSTRIFCRPSCPARRPSRGGALFFDTPQEAADAGFRACKRCRPDEETDANQERVQQARLLIEQSIEAGDSISLQVLADSLSVSASHLQRTFKRDVGVSPREYADALRLQRLKSELREGQSVLSAQIGAGYTSRALYEKAPAQLGMTPASYKRGGQGTRISFQIASCDLGFLLVAATPKGICAVSLGDSEVQLEADLRVEFFAAEISRAPEDEVNFAAWFEALLPLVEAGARELPTLPLDVRATEFQLRVWAILRQVARGETRSYTQVAEELGQPSAVRAVARACATNPVALIVPCHRVLRGDGSLAGYRWGIERKKALLEREQIDS